MSNELTERDEVLIELVYYLAVGRIVLDKKDGLKYHIPGIKLKDIKSFMETHLEKKNTTVISCIDLEGREFLNELKSYINKKENI